MRRSVRVSISVTGVVNARVDVEVNGSLRMTIHEHQSDSKSLTLEPEESCAVSFVVYSHAPGAWKAQMRVTVNTSPVLEEQPTGWADRGGLQVFQKACYPV